MKRSVIFLAVTAAVAACFIGCRTNSARHTNIPSTEIVYAQDGEQAVCGMPRVIFKNRHGKPV